MRVLIVDDHEILAASLRAGLSANGVDVHTAPATDGADILGRVEDLEPHLVLLDIDLGRGARGGIELIGPITERGATVVMLTGQTDRALHGACLEQGAIAVLEKRMSFDELVAAVQSVARDEALVSDHERQNLLAELRRSRAEEDARLRPFRKLTPRERQVLDRLMHGLSADQIAAEWVVSVSTVRSQIRAVLNKLDVNSQLSATAKAREAGWTLEST